MKYFVLSIFDTATQAYSQPFYSPAEAAAVRTVRDMVQGKDNQLSLHPEDFELRALGMFDDNSGVLIPESPRLVSRCKDLISRSN